MPTNTSLMEPPIQSCLVLLVLILGGVLDLHAQANTGGVVRKHSVAGMLLVHPEVYGNFLLIPLLHTIIVGILQFLALGHEAFHLKHSSGL